MYEAFSAKFVRNVDANRTIKDELTAAIRTQGARRRISVTDLVNPRQAFFRRTRPDIQPSAERAQTMMTGTGVHAQFERTISTEEFAEQFVTYEDIVGKIDIYEDAPVELKTTSFQDRDGVVRPSYLDQLGMYCAMTGIPRGHLVVYYTPRSGDGAVLSAYAVELSNLAEIRTGMIRRRDLFQRALDAGTPSGLPQCEWYGRRCDYQDVCGCEAAPPLERVVRADMATVTRDPGLEDQINEKLRRSGARPTGYRIHHLLFPRKTAYRQQPDAVVEEDESSEARLKEIRRRGFYEALTKALQYGFPGGFRSIPVGLRTLADRVSMFRGVPTLVRTTGFRRMIDRDRLPQEMSWNVDRLAFICALAESAQGRLILYYNAIPDDKFMVYEIGFKDLPTIRAEVERRVALLESGAAPDKLPPCPAWMYETCEFAPHCEIGRAHV